MKKINEDEFHEAWRTLVKRMRNTQSRTEMLTGEEHMDFVDMLFVEQREAETEVDEYLNEVKI